jgi:hypothetical protein
MLVDRTCRLRWYPIIYSNICVVQFISKSSTCAELMGQIYRHSIWSRVYLYSRRVGSCSRSIRHFSYQRHPTTAAASFVQAQAKITTSQRPFGSWDNEIDDEKLGLSFVRLAKCRQCPSTFLDPYGRSVMGLLPRLQWMRIVEFHFLSVHKTRVSSLEIRISMIFPKVLGW